MIERRHDWPERLRAVVEAARTRPFEWGKHDCALFTCDCAYAMTGHDFAAPFRGRYRTAKGALRALKRFEGVASLAELATKYLGPPVAPTLARRGDAVMMPSDCVPGFEQGLGVCVGGDAACLGPGGLVLLPMRRAISAWPVGWRE